MDGCVWRDRAASYRLETPLATVWFVVWGHTLRAPLCMCTLELHVRKFGQHFMLRFRARRWVGGLQWDMISPRVLCHVFLFVCVLLHLGRASQVNIEPCVARSMTTTFGPGSFIMVTLAINQHFSKGRGVVLFSQQRPLLHDAWYNHPCFCNRLMPDMIFCSCGVARFRFSCKSTHIVDMGTISRSVMR